jgi:hypothetical protein
MRQSCYGRAASLLLALSVPIAGLLPATAQAQIGIGVSITLAPPALPVYAQPEIPGPGYLWTPGYWAWDEGDYYWVPGTWVLAPQPGYLWTPGYWGWLDGAYLWHGGYWGPHVGFYGGVNYGYGYGGAGYQGGYWDHDHFYYNRSVNNIRGNTRITNVYNKTVINNPGFSRVSFNGGTGGTAARPSALERTAATETHLPPVQEQVQHQQVAHTTPTLRASVNHGNPPIAATARAGVLSGPGVIATAPRARSVQPAERTAGPSPNRPVGTPHEAAVQHATVQHAPAAHTPLQHASMPPAPAPAPRAAPERLAVRAPAPAAPPPAAPRPAATHEAAPRASPPHAPEEHREQGGGERER